MHLRMYNELKLTGDGIVSPFRQAQRCYQFTDSEGMDGLIGLVKTRTEPRTLNRNACESWAPSDCADTSPA